VNSPGIHGLLPFTIFALAGALSPGPNNSIAMMTGANSGMRAVLPHLLGVPAGFALMTALAGAGGHST
jgi:threonine/homoserine/homoserine lactone efflux protein